MIRDFREKYKDTLLLDAGDFFWPEEKLGALKAEITARAMKVIGYDALNVADGELNFGIDFLKRADPEVKEAFVSSNVSGREGLPWQSCLIKTKNGLRVAILGIVLPDLVNHTLITEDGISLEDPEACLKRMLSDVRQKSDLVVLMSHMGWEPTRALIGRVSGIDIAIIGHGLYPTLDPEKAGRTILLKNSMDGKHLGVVKLWLDDSRKIREFKSSLEELSKDVNVYSEYRLFEMEFQTKKMELDRKQEQLQEKDRMMEKYKDWLKLSPEEFVDMMRRKKEAIDVK